jgi:hypothetical protein
MRRFTLALLPALGLLAPLAAQAQCRDPWLNQIYRQLYNRAPVGQGESCECNIKLYNNGSWANYQELTNFVKQLQQTGLRFGYAPLGNNTVMAVAQGNLIQAVSVLDANGNLVAAGGGNLVAAGGGNLVAAGGGNLTGLRAATPGFGFGSGYSVQSGEKRRLPTSGKGAIVIK